MPSKETICAASLTLDTPVAHTLRLSLAGEWRMRSPVPRAADVEQRIEEEPDLQRVEFDTTGLGAWDSRVLTFLVGVGKLTAQHGLDVDRGGLPKGVQRLLDLAEAVPEKETPAPPASPSLLAQLGTATVRSVRESRAMLTFGGEALLALGRLTRGRARFRRVDMTATMQASGVQALGIVSLISFLVGLILAFIGSLELRKFGAEIYVANLVGMGMAREMAAMMTAIIMAGRTGAAFAAQLGTMTVNEEIDALRTLAIPPMDFLVLPRMLALALMMPLLALYSIAVGILGGALVALVFLDISPTLYFEQLQGALGLVDIAVGVFKASVFGVLVAFAGCFRGMQSGRSAAAVGSATTSAVVTGIVLIIVTGAAFDVILNVLRV